MSITIPGLGTIPVSQTEYITAAVLQPYLTDINTLLSIFDKRSDVASINNANPQNPVIASTPDPNDLNSIADAVKRLTNLLYHGAVEGTPPNTYTSYLPTQLALSLSLALQSLKAVGIDSNFDPNSIPTDAAKVALIQQWQSLAGVGVEQVLRTAANVGPDPTRSLQSMIELEYVKNGNDIIFGHLGNLEQALQTSQGILDTLQIIEGISNQIKAPSVGTITLPNPADYPDPDAFAQAYQKAVQAKYTQQIPIPIPTSTSGYQLLAAKAQLSAQLAALQTQANQSATSANTLAFFISRVIKDISTAFAGKNLNDKGQVLSAVSTWIMDGQNVPLGQTGTTAAGRIQDNITQAIKSVESLNDTQKENVRNYMFIFQQFYQSSSSALQKINQIVEKLAQGISH